MAVVLLLASASRAQAQASDEADDSSFDLGAIVAALVEGVGSVASGSYSSFFEFLESVEFLNAESEIDRLVGNPWLLHDATSYKLSLLPFHIRFPIYRQLVIQLTRQDVLRSRRIHTVTTDSARIVTLDLATLSWNPTDDVVPGLSAEVQSSMLTHFDGRELVDLACYAMAQRDFFPRTDEGWGQLKKTIARGAVPLALTALVVGAAFDVGALGQTGTIVRRDDGRLGLGWYGGVKRLGFEWRPIVRAGFTARAPGLELAAGIADQVNPTDEDEDRAVELAVREGWLNNLVARGIGWDAFFEAAVHRVVDVGDAYAGEDMTGRAGLFLKREHLFRNPNLTMRTSLEVESDLDQEIRYAVSLGLERPRSGMMLLVQASRERYRGDEDLIDSRAGVFLAGTMEPPASGLVEEAQRRARHVAEEWELAGGAGASDADLARIALMLADYLESRRRAYSTLRMRRDEDDLYGPLDPSVLVAVRDAILARVLTTRAALERQATRLDRIRRHEAIVREEIHDLEDLELGPGPAPAGALEDSRRELTRLGRERERHAAAARAALAAYHEYTSNLRRMRAVAARLLPEADLDPLPRGIARRLVLETASPW